MNKEIRNLSTDEKRFVIKKKGWNIRDWLSGDNGKAIGVISDKQYVLFTEDLDMGDSIEDAASLLYEERDVDKTVYDEDLYYEINTSSDNPKFIIKYDGVIANNQYEFLNNILDELKEQNIVYKISDIEETDIDKVKEILKKDVQKDKITHDIYIFGKKLSSEKNIENFKEKLNKDFKNINEVIDSINKIGKDFLNDDFYFQILRKIMPNYGDIIYRKERLKSILPLLDNIEDEKYKIDIFDMGKLIHILNGEYNRFMKDIDHIFEMTNMTMDQRIHILNKCIENNNDIESIYPDIKNFIYFYYYYKNTLTNDLFDGITDYQMCFNFMLNHVRENLQNNLANQELTKNILEAKIKDKEVVSQIGKYYRYNEEINDAQNRLNIIDAYKKYDIEEIKRDYEVSRKKDKIEQNQEKTKILKGKIEELESQVKLYDKLGPVYRFFKKKSNQVANEELKFLIKQRKATEEEIIQMQNDIEAINESRSKSKHEREKQIEELKKKIKKTKQKFKEETTISFDEYEEKSKHYSNFDKDLDKKYEKICEDIKNTKSQLEKLESFIEQKNNKDKKM